MNKDKQEEADGAAGSAADLSIVDDASSFGEEGHRAQVTPASGYALTVLILGMLATGFPFTILTMALKYVAEDFGVSEAFATWSVSAPMLISAVCMPFLGKLGDLYGHRLVFLIGIAGSSFFALLCFFSWDTIKIIIFPGGIF